MAYPDELPPLSELIPAFIGEVTQYQGQTYVSLEKVAEYADCPDHRIIRCGFRVYEVLGQGRNAWLVREFDCTLSEADLMVLSEQATIRRSDAKGEAA